MVTMDPCQIPVLSGLVKFYNETIIFLKKFKEYLVLPHIFLVTLQVDQRIIFQSLVLFLNLCMPSVFLFLCLLCHH